MYKLRRKLLLLQRNFWIYVNNLQIKYKTHVEARIALIEKEQKNKAFKEREKREMLEAKLLAKLEAEVIEEEQFQEKLKKNTKAFMKQFKKRLLRNGNRVCESCGRDCSDKNATVDHIVPRSILRSMGFTEKQLCDERNLRLLCVFCNSSKGSNLDFTDYRTKKLMLEYLSDVPDVPDVPKKN